MNALNSTFLCLLLAAAAPTFAGRREIRPHPAPDPTRPGSRERQGHVDDVKKRKPGKAGKGPTG